MRASFWAAGVVGLQQLAGVDGIPGHETDALLLAVGERFLMPAVAQTVSILDSDDGDDLARLPQSPPA